MSGHSYKKKNQNRLKANKFLLLAIAIATGLYIVINAYFVLFKSHVITKKQLVGFAFLSGMNYVLYSLIDSFRGSYWESYMIDVFGLNLAVEVLINFYWKFWYLYLVYPGFFFFWAGKKIFEYVKTIGKENLDEEPQSQPHQSKQKTKYVKVR